MAKQTFTTGQVLTAAQMTSLQQTAMGGGAATAKTTSYVLTAADAGTVVQMNAAGATTITVNTALFAAGDSVQIQNIGAGVCTITAGTATVTTAGSLALSQWEGANLYFTSTSASIYFDIVQGTGMTNPMTTTGDTIYSSSGSTPARLGIGTTGQVLTVASGVPSWASPAGGGKLLQVVTAVNTTSYYTTSASYGDTGLTATITPTSATSTILVMVSQFCRAVRNSTQQAYGISLLRGATQIWENPYAASISAASNAGTIEIHGVTPIIYRDSPATTSATTYKTQGKPYDNSSGGSAEYQFQSKPSTITLFEIGA